MSAILHFDADCDCHDEQGRVVYSFRQSFLNDFSMCPEQARRKMQGLAPDKTTDAASYGTALHAVIEENIEEVMRTGDPWSRDDSFDLFLNTFYELAAADNFRWTKLSKGSVEQHGRKAIEQFFDQVLPVLSPVATEVGFKNVLLHEDDERVINLEGTIDYIDAKLGLVDWKTASRAYEPWEKKRWAIQPTVYTYANEMATKGVIDNPQNFTYYIFVRGGDVQRLTVQRTAGDYAWLKARCINVVKLIEADLDEWPMRDDGWWCSPLWCPVWNDCRGQHLGDNPW